jgi:glycosyltransferase involved in cell wall biosynthesis
MTDRKVLVSVYSCAPGSGSEPGVGWNWVRQIARHNQVWAITRANNRPSIELELKRSPLRNVTFSYYDLPPWSRFWKRGSRGVALYYYLWQMGIYRLARQVHARESLDLVHHVTFGKYWAPSFLAMLGPKFIWGPLGGGESAPDGFRHTFNLRGKAYETARDLGRTIEQLDPFVRLTARRSTLALAKTPETAQRLKQIGCRDVKVFQEVSLPLAEIQALGRIPVHNPPPLRMLSIGRLLHWKGFYLAIDGFARLHQQFADAEYTIVGTGPERANLERLARELGVSDKVRFLGAIPRSEVLAELGRSDVLVHPSLHDSSGWVCIEAMASGRPVICLDCGGPATQVTAESGCRVPADSPVAAITGIADAMLALAQDPELRRRLGEGGKRRVAADFNSERMAISLAAIYEQVQSQFAARDGVLSAVSSK